MHTSRRNGNLMQKSLVTHTNFPEYYQSFIQHGSLTQMIDNILLQKQVEDHNSRVPHVGLFVDAHCKYRS